MSDGRIRYARNGAVRLAYRILGNGESTLVFAPGWAGNIGWYDEPTNPFATAIQAIASSHRVLVFDRRGNGLSDPSFEIPTVGERAADLLAILDDAGWESPPLMSQGDAGPSCIQLAVSHPDRVGCLIFYASAARFSQKLPDFPWGFTAEQIEDIDHRIESEWGEGLTADLLFGDAADVPGVRETLGRLQRATVGATGIRLQWQEIVQVDVRHLLGKIRTPTLVLSRPGDRMVQFEAAAALAAGIEGAQFHPLPPGPHANFDITDVVAGEVLGFIAGEPVATVQQRLLQTILFTDIVGSTDLLSAHGDAHWHHQMNVHDDVVDGLLAKYGGRRVNHTGDGILALFEGPTNSVRCGLALISALAQFGIPIRAGVHVGECERRGSEWSGMAIHVGARIAALAGPGQLFASRTVRDLCAGSGLGFNDLGPHRLKGIPEDASVYLVDSTSSK